LSFQEEHINPLDLDSDIAVGLALPLANPSGGGFALNYTTMDQAKTNLRNLLKTNKGERYMQPEFGADLISVLFEPNTDEIIEKLKNKVTQAVENWLPYISIKTFVVTGSEHNIKLDINFIINNNEFNSESITLTLPIPAGTI
jgi:phage baseplate assembly protein W